MSDSAATGTALSPAAQSERPRRIALVLVVVLLTATVIYLRVAGRAWWCACRTPTPFSVHVHSSHNSQHLLDPYSFSHLLHGLIFYFALRALLPRAPLARIVVLGLLLESAWEAIENSPAVIERYRAATASLGYSGDTIVNTLGDIGSCALGMLLARRIGLMWSVIVFVAVELTMLALIRDNLTLNVLMLLAPLEPIRQWQLQAAPTTLPVQ